MYRIIYIDALSAERDDCEIKFKTKENARSYLSENGFCTLSNPSGKYDDNGLKTMAFVVEVKWYY